DLDVIGGSAGCIAGLLCLDACAPSPSLRRIAAECGDHLIARARSMPHGVGWAPTFPSAGPLTGFSHGVAGISWVLLELATQTGEGRFRVPALGGIAYERSLFSPEARNWPDLRLSEAAARGTRAEPAGFGVSWCHGAPGIGLARLRCLPHLEDPLLLAEIEAATATTLAGG